MTFDYSISASQSGFNYEPLVRTYIVNLKTGREVLVWGLVDSGATATLAHPQIAQVLGIEAHTGETRTFIGVGGKTSGYAHKVGLRLDGESEVYEIECSFTDFAGEGALLGQDGFFDYFKASFEKYNGTFSLTKAKKGG